MKYIIVLCLVTFPFAGSPQELLLNDLNTYLIPIKTFSANDSFSDISGLQQAFANARVIGLGEAAHGTREFLLYKHRLLRFLVTEMGFRTLVIEGDFSGAKLMNEYVTNGRGTAYDALRAIGVGFWINQDFMEMVEWIRSYNSQHQAADQVRFYGCDMQYPITVLQQLRNGAIQLGHPLSAAGLAGLDILINNINYRKLSDPEIAKVKNAISEIRSDRSADIKRNNEQFYQHEIRTIEQLLEFESASPGKNQFALRDRFMAENSTWIYRHEDSAKTIIWAHNGHIAKYKTVSPSQPMGAYLAVNFKAKYYALGFGFNSGSVRAASIPSTGTTRIFNVPAVETKNSFDYVLSKCDQPNFILDFKTASASTEIRDFINKRYYSRSIGSSYSNAKFGKGKDIDEPLALLYDGIAFIRTIHAAPAEIYKN